MAQRMLATAFIRVCGQIGGCSAGIAAGAPARGASIVVCQLRARTLKPAKCAALPLWEEWVEEMHVFLRDEIGLGGAQVEKAARDVGGTVMCSLTARETLQQAASTPL